MDTKAIVSTILMVVIIILEFFGIIVTNKDGNSTRTVVHDDTALIKQAIEAHERERH